MSGEWYLMPGDVFLFSGTHRRYNFIFVLLERHNETYPWWDALILDSQSQDFSITTSIDEAWMFQRCNRVV